VTPPAEAAAWSAALGGHATVLARSVPAARALLLRAAGLTPGAAVGVPANATRGLIEAIKRADARPLFLPLTDDLRPTTGHSPGAPTLIWAEPVGGLPSAAPPDGPLTVADHGDTLPAPDIAAASGAAAITLWGLHLSERPDEAGALLALTDPTAAAARALWAAVECLAADAPGPPPARALAQAHRLLGAAHSRGLADRQRAALAETRRGLAEAAGLPLLPAGGTALAHHVAIRIPDECDPATFYAYVLGENTPVRWLPLVRPIHHAAIVTPAQRAALAATAERLGRWLLAPVGPDYTDEEIKHAVLGVVKAAEYLGVRWRLDPARASEYADLMVAMYGPDHDAYRPAFIVEGAARR
jgi:hypothetical protein